MHNNCAFFAAGLSCSSFMPSINLCFWRKGSHKRNNPRALASSAVHKIFQATVVFSSLKIAGRRFLAARASTGQ